MASVTIDKRQKANGDFSYRCTIRVKKNGVIIHRESKTFSKKELAKTWGKIRKEAVELNSITAQDKVISIGELLDLFINDVYLWAATGRTKQYVVKMLRDYPIADVLSNQLKSSDL
ncbi:integrase [Colwellia marinimaniae]|uniref:Integrase n=1 Tax=Colwellia marinimaniae TaxID=1513592 RepID=A0ABQ0N079_9GAMM|nr:integrase [Colwellia marinimaniae]